VEIIRERYITRKTDLNYQDFDAFFNKQSEWHSELEKMQPVTKNKLRQVLFKILREADLLSENNTITTTMLSTRLIEAIPDDRRDDILIFPNFKSVLLMRAK
jgi:hypothetical protein